MLASSLLVFAAAAVLPDVQEPLVEHRTDGDYVTLLVDGIHCAACQWLIERGMQAMPGIIEAQLNLSARRLRVGWRPDQTRLSFIIRELAKFGYRAEPLDPPLERPFSFVHQKQKFRVRAIEELLDFTRSSWRDAAG